MVFLDFFDFRVCRAESVGEADVDDDVDGDEEREREHELERELDVDLDEELLDELPLDKLPESLDEDSVLSADARVVPSSILGALFGWVSVAEITVVVVAST